MPTPPASSPGTLVPQPARRTDRTLIWNIPHLRRLLREYERFYNRHRAHRALGQAAPLRPLPDNVIDLETLRVRRRDHAAGLLHGYRHVAQVIGILKIGTATLSGSSGTEDVGMFSLSHDNSTAGAATFSQFSTS